MTRRLTTTVFAILVLSLTTLTTVAPADARKSEIAFGEVAGTTLTVSPRIAFESASLRVAGPGRYEAIAWSQGEPLTLDLATDGYVSPWDGGGVQLLASLPDGRYGYEVVFYLATGARRVHHGRFLVEDGVVIEDGPSVDGSRSALSGGLIAEEEQEGPKNVNSAATPADDSLQVLDSNNDDYTYLALQNTDWDSGATDDYSVVNDSGDLLIGGMDETGPVMPYRFSIRHNGNVGIGTTLPGAELHVAGPGGVIRIADTDPCPGNSSVWDIEEDFGRLMFDLVGNCATDTPGGKLWITGSGDVGIGTGTPGEELEIVRAFPSIRLRDDDASPQIWDIEGNSFDFQIQDVTNGGIAPLLIEPGTPHRTLHLDGTGRIGIGTASPAARLHVIGDGIIEGDVAFGSSRTIKHEIEPLEGNEILRSLRDLAVYSWKYEEDPVQATHFGPMAEDMYQLFRVGRDEKHLSPADSAGLALAAVKGVDEELAELREVVRALAAENGALRDRLATLEGHLRAGTGEEK